MLRELRIRNLAVIDEVVVPLLPGLNVLTGETGAGKSILVDAILLVIGARAQPDLIRSGEECAVVEALFEVGDSEPVASLLDESGHRVEDGQLVVKRELWRSGRHRVFVNDSPATVGLLERLGDLLVELHGQHEHQKLMEPVRQLDLLDRFAECVPRRESVSRLVRRWEEARRALAALREQLAAAAKQEDLYRFQLSEIDAARLRVGEEEELRTDRVRLQHAERIFQGLQEVMGLLHEDDRAAAARLSRAASLLQGLSRLDAGAVAPVGTLEAALALVEDAVMEIRGLRDRAVAEPERLTEIESRLDAIAKLKRKYGETEAAILAYRQELTESLERLGAQDAVLAERQREEEALARAAAEEAVELSAMRARAAQRLERQIQKEVRGLGMAECRVRVALHREPAGPADLVCGNGWRVGPRGAEGAEFLFSANPGEDLRPLGKVISGGELSRTMLAVKTILATADETPTLVFDEVDAGIGGRVADIVGQRLRQTAAGRQVLCVTHLAPIAVHATHHLVVEKHVTRGSTRTSVTPLREGDRVEELARMLGGERVTEASRRHARDLLRAARP
ncbi:MAG TPA: DNA repair protein RecN [Candidatus Methylomirabilis sp.]|nr:DNA repair protein RecN [Candidatus Methylomirabilis sp.]